MTDAQKHLRCAGKKKKRVAAGITKAGTAYCQSDLRKLRARPNLTFSSRRVCTNPIIGATRIAMPRECQDMGSKVLCANSRSTIYHRRLVAVLAAISGHLEVLP